MSDLIGLLEAVRDVYSVRGYGWTSGSYGATAKGKLVYWNDPGVRKLCLAGAIELVTEENALDWEQRRALYRAFAWLPEIVQVDLAEWIPVEQWNDAPGRTFGDVKHAIEATIDAEYARLSVA